MMISDVNRHNIYTYMKETLNFNIHPPPPYDDDDDDHHHHCCHHHHHPYPHTTPGDIEATKKKITYCSDQNATKNSNEPFVNKLNTPL